MPAATMTVTRASAMALRRRYAITRRMRPHHSSRHAHVAVVFITLHSLPSPTSFCFDHLPVILPLLPAVRCYLRFVPAQFMLILHQA